MYQEGGIALRTNPVTLPSLIKSVPPLGSSLGTLLTSPVQKLISSQLFTPEHPKRQNK